MYIVHWTSRTSLTLICVDVKAQPTSFVTVRVFEKNLGPRSKALAGYPVSIGLCSTIQTQYPDPSQPPQPVLGFRGGVAKGDRGWDQPLTPNPMPKGVAHYIVCVQ